MGSRSSKVDAEEDSWKDTVYPGWRESSEKYFAGPRGENMFYRLWSPPKGCPQKGILLTLHGIRAHSGCHSPECFQASKRGFFVYAIDHLGHGKSPGARLDVKSFQYFVDDAFALLKLAKEEHPTLPLILFGHSMGSCVGLHLLAKCADLNGDSKLVHAAVFTGYCQEPGPGSMKPLNTKNCFCLWTNMNFLPVVKLASQIAPLAPAANITSADLHDNEAAHKLNKQKLDTLHCHQPVKNRISYEVLKAMKESPQYYSKINAPLMLLHGRDDTLCLVKGADRLHEEVASKDKKLVVYDGLKHEIFKDSDEALDEFLTWLSAHVP